MSYLHSKEQRERYKQSRLAYQREYRRLHPSQREPILKVMNFRDLIIKQEWEEYVRGVLEQYPNISLTELRGLLRSKTLVSGRNAVQRRLFTMGVWDNFKRKERQRATNNPSKVKERRVNIRQNILSVLRGRQEYIKIGDLIKAVTHIATTEMLSKRTIHRQIQELADNGSVEMIPSGIGQRGRTFFVKEER